MHFLCLLSHFNSRAEQLKETHLAQKDQSIYYLALTESLPIPDLKIGSQGTNYKFTIGTELIRAWGQGVAKALSNV